MTGAGFPRPLARWFDPLLERGLSSRSQSLPRLGQPRASACFASRCGLGAEDRRSACWSGISSKIAWPRRTRTGEGLRGARGSVAERLPRPAPSRRTAWAAGGTITSPPSVRVGAIGWSATSPGFSRARGAPPPRGLSVTRGRARFSGLVFLGSWRAARPRRRKGSPTCRTTPMRARSKRGAARCKRSHGVLVPASHHRCPCAHGTGPDGRARARISARAAASSSASRPRRLDRRATARRASIRSRSEISPASYRRWAWGSGRERCCRRGLVAQHPLRRVGLGQPQRNALGHLGLHARPDCDVAPARLLQLGLGAGAPCPGSARTAEALHGEARAGLETLAALAVGVDAGR